LDLLREAPLFNQKRDDYCKRATADAMNIGEITTDSGDYVVFLIQIGVVVAVLGGCTTV